MKHTNKHIFEQKVYYADTDAYGVVWHGSYIKWLEMGRIELLEQMGHNLQDLVDKNIVLPLVGLNIRYKSSAKLNDEMIIETQIHKFSAVSVTFDQKIMSKKTGKIFIEASVECVAINNEGKLYRRLPQILIDTFNNVANELEKV